MADGSIPYTYALYESRVVRYCQFAAAVVIVYEHLLQLANEIDLFWCIGRYWSIPKCLFLFSRYFSLSLVILNAHYMMDERPSLEVSTKFFRWQMIGVLTEVVIVHCILGLRIYAMYGRRKSVLVFFTLLLSAEITIMGIISIPPKEGLLMTNEPLPGLFICADADPHYSPWVAFNWTTGLVVETILLCMSLYKAWSYYRTGGSGSLVSELARDSVLYFFFIFWLYVFNQSIWLINKITLTEIGTGPFIAICSILAHRLLIAVRARYYGMDDTIPHETTMEFAPAHYVNSGGDNMTILSTI